MAEKNGNLVSFDQIPKERHKEISHKGGIASGIARQERKQLKEELSALLSAGDTQERVCTALINKVLQGNERAFAILRDSLGEKEAEQLEIAAGSSLESFRENHKMEIMQLYHDESALKFDGKPTRYGQLAHCLASKAQKDVVYRQLMLEREIIDIETLQAWENRENENK